MSELSNQSFQPIYIDDDAKDDNDKIVLIEEMSESLPEATGVLNSLFKEKFYGMVAAGSTIALADFRAKLYDFDKENKLGSSKDISEILKKIVDVCYDCNCEMVYYKGPSLYKDLPADLKNLTVAFDFKQLAKDIGVKGKEFFNELVNTDSIKAKQELDKMDLKQAKKLMEQLHQDEEGYKKLQKALKDSDKVNPDNLVNDMITEMDIDDNLQHFLGKEYANQYFYYIDKEGIDVVQEDLQVAFWDLFERDKNKDKVKDKAGAEAELRKILGRIIRVGITDKNEVVLSTESKIPSYLLQELGKNYHWPSTNKSVTLKDLGKVDWTGNKTKKEEEKKLETKSPELKKNENRQGFQKRFENLDKTNFQGPVPVKKTVPTKVR